MSLEVTPERRRSFFGGIALVVLLVLAFVSGRYSAPTKTVEKVRVEKVEVEVEKVVEKVVVKRELVQAKARIIVRTVHEVAKPDGTLERTSTTTSGSSSSSAAAEEGSSDARRETSRSSSEVAEHSKTVERTDSRIKLGALVGTNLWRLAAPPLIGGPQLEVRIVGPIWLGVYVLTDGDLGGSLAVAW